MPAIKARAKGRSIMDWKLELVPIPVSNVDCAKAFYTEKAGFDADHDHRVTDEILESQPGSVQGLQLVVSDVNAARVELVERGIAVSEVQEFDWGSFVFFGYPDGNGWSVQQLLARD
jgi:hypothetical protein